MKPWRCGSPTTGVRSPRSGQPWRTTRETHPLFNSGWFRRNIEAAYLIMWERSQAGEPPESFAVDPIALDHHQIGLDRRIESELNVSSSTAPRTQRPPAT